MYQKAIKNFGSIFSVDHVMNIKMKKAVRRRMRKIKSSLIIIVNGAALMESRFLLTTRKKRKIIIIIIKNKDEHGTLKILRGKYFFRHSWFSLSKHLGDQSVFIIAKN